MTMEDDDRGLALVTRRGKEAIGNVTEMKKLNSMKKTKERRK